MVNLIIAILSLFFIAIVLVASYDVLSAEGRVRAEAERRLQSDIENMARGIDAFLVEARDMATGTSDVGPPGTLITGELASEFIYIPRAIQGAAWSAGIGDPNPMVCGARPTVWVCLQPPTDGWRPGVMQAMIDVGNNRLAEGSSVFAPQCPDGAGGGEPGDGDQGHWIVAMPTDPPGGGRQSMLVNSVGAVVPVTYDHLRPVRVRYNLVAQLGANLEGVAEWAQATLQIRPPGSVVWISVDSWRIQVQTEYDRTIAMQHDGEELNVLEFVSAQSHRMLKTGSIEGPVPPGWQVRWVATTSSDNATIVAGTGQISRFMGQVNPIDI